MSRLGLLRKRQSSYFMANYNTCQPQHQAVYSEYRDDKATIFSFACVIPECVCGQIFVQDRKVETPSQHCHESWIDKRFGSASKGPVRRPSVSLSGEGNEDYLPSGLEFHFAHLFACVVVPYSLTRTRLIHVRGTKLDHITYRRCPPFPRR
ncbi:hypothetical protein BJ508DRAFT_5160 [Ascobolus immersus RN42]|uniref:Uncharacterized protein n=1 Tax=Ascobolus immersus RN42 TaxID=1160509 RepID=A0A3N4IQ06_ASCIM|nr:hypothetical protein BJ508DRAFT_5160 [Ascobolus immersus RN42]